MAELSYILRGKYRDAFDTLKNTSYDKEHNSYMCQSQREVVNFDRLTEIYISGRVLPKSFDALICDEGNKKVFCVEFKNQEKSTINNRIIQEKMLEGKNTLDRIIGENSVQRKEYELVFCVAYKANNKHYRYRNKLEDRALHFNLDKYNDTFDKVITNDIEFFTDEFRRKYQCEES